MGVGQCKWAYVGGGGCMLVLESGGGRSWLMYWFWGEHCRVGVLCNDEGVWYTYD